MGASLESPRALTVSPSPCCAMRSWDWAYWQMLQNPKAFTIHAWRFQGSAAAISTNYCLVCFFCLLRDHLSVLNCSSAATWQHAELLQRGKLLLLYVGFPWRSIAHPVWCRLLGSVLTSGAGVCNSCGCLLHRKCHRSSVLSLLVRSLLESTGLWFILWPTKRSVAIGVCRQMFLVLVQESMSKEMQMTCFILLK